MISETVAALSGWQLSISILFYLLSLPLSLGLAYLLVALEILSISNPQQTYQAASRFWTRVFIINLIFGTGARLALFCQMGMSASYFAFYAGNIFALPLAIDTLSNFFLLSACIGPFWFKAAHYSRTHLRFLLALIVISSYLSAFCLLSCYGWLQYPGGAEFNPSAYRLEINNFSAIFSNPLIFSHSILAIAAACSIAAATILAICTGLQNQKPENSIAKLSIKPIAVLGFCTTLMVSIAEMSEFSYAKQKVDLPSTTQETRIRNGIKAYTLLSEIRDEKHDLQLLTDFDQLKGDLGYALLLKRSIEHIETANDNLITLTAKSSIASQTFSTTVAFYSILVCSFSGIIYFAWLIYCSRTSVTTSAILPRLTLWVWPMTWFAGVCGWYLAESARYPWAVVDLLPAFLSSSSLSNNELMFSLTISLALYLLLLTCCYSLIRYSMKHNTPST